MFSKVLITKGKRSFGITPAKISGRRNFAINVPLTDFLPHFTVPEGKLSAPVYRSSTLPNGLKVITVDGNHPVSSVGLFVNSGSRFEDASTAGASFFLKQMAFKSLSGLTTLRLVRTIELLGATYEVSCGREHMAFTSQVLSERVPSITEVLLQNLDPRLVHWEIRDEVEHVAKAAEKIESNPRALTFELLHQEAYRNRGLGQSLYAPLFNIHNLNEDVLRNFISKNYRFDGAAIVATGGVSHEQFKEIVAASLPTLNTTERPPVISEYIGGDTRLAGYFNSHVALGFQGVGLNSKEFYATAVLEKLLGRGSTVGHDPIGTGQASRLSSRVVSRQSFIEEISAFNLNYSDSGLFGVYAVAQRGKVHVLVEMIIRELDALKKLTDEEVQRAKAVLLSQYAATQDSRLNLLEFIGKNAVINAPKQDLPSNFTQAINAVTTQDVLSVVNKVLKSKPTLVVLGDVEGTPTTETIRASFK